MRRPEPIQVGDKVFIDDPEDRPASGDFGPFVVRSVEGGAACLVGAGWYDLIQLSHPRTDLDQIADALAERLDIEADEVMIDPRHQFVSLRSVDGRRLLDLLGLGPRLAARLDDEITYWSARAAEQPDNQLQEVAQTYVDAYRKAKEILAEEATPPLACEHCGADVRGLHEESCPVVAGQVFIDTGERPGGDS